MMHCEKKKFKAKISYADKLKIPFVVFLGEDEIKEGRATVKDMKTGEQTAIEFRLAAELIASKLKKLGSGAPIQEPK